MKQIHGTNAKKLILVQEKEIRKKVHSHSINHIIHAQKASHVIQRANRKRGCPRNEVRLSIIKKKENLYGKNRYDI